MATLGKLGSVLPELEWLVLIESSDAAGPDGVQCLAKGLSAGALPHLALLSLDNMHVGEAGASAIAGALVRGALPQLEVLFLNNAAIGDAALVALAPALRRLPALESLYICGNPFGDEGLAALLAPPLPTEGLKKLRTLFLDYTQVTNGGCATLVAALDSGALPPLHVLYVDHIPASAAAREAVHAALARSRARAAFPFG